jgi:hypothetical protein
MHLTYIDTLSINHITTIMHKATTTQDIRGSPPAWGYIHQLFSFIIFVQCIEPQDPLHIGKDIYAHLARSSFPKLGHNTKPSYTVYTPASYNHLHLALQLLTHSMHKASSSTLSHKHSLLLLLSYIT